MVVNGKKITFGCGRGNLTAFLHFRDASSEVSVELEGKYMPLGKEIRLVK